MKKATFSVYCAGGSKGTEKKFIYRITKDWTINQATWLHAKAGEKWDPASTSHLKQGGAYTLEGGAEIPYGPEEQWEDFDVTAIVKFMLANPNLNFGFLAVDDEESGHSQRLYASSDYTDDPSLKPKLTIDYSAAVSYFPQTALKNRINLRITGSTLRFSLPYKNSRAAIRNAKGQTVASLAGNAGGGCELAMGKFGAGMYFFIVTDGVRSETAGFFVME